MSVITEAQRAGRASHRPELLANHEQAVQAAHAFAARIADGAIERDRSGELPEAELADLDNSGLLAITIPAQYGGSGLGERTLAETTRIIAAVDPAIAQAAQGHFLFVDVLSACGSDWQRRRIFADVLEGSRIANALAERGGIHAQDLKTRLSGETGLHASTTGIAPLLNGRKYYATGALTAAWIATSALGDDGKQRLAFVKREQPGVSLDRDWNTIGQRATVSGSVSYEDVAVDPELVLEYWQCFESPQQFGARAQLYHSAIQVGIADGALRDARWFVREKARPFFEAARAGIASTAVEDPHTLHRFGELAVRVSAAEALLEHTARELDQIGRIPVDAQAAARGSIAVATLKAFASETAVAVASDLFSLAGASAADRKYGLDRHWRNARTHASHDPVDWKYHHVGNYLLADVLPPNHGQL
jgi:SfnB family sulfur acquisition oxidoreductase